MKTANQNKPSPEYYEEDDVAKVIEKNQQAIKLLESWCNGDEAEQKETWKFLQKFLDEDRLSSRKLFPEKI